MPENNTPSSSLYRTPSIEVRKCEFGLGVFANTLIPSGSLLEECHYIKFQRDDCASQEINDYIFMVADDPDTTPEECTLCALVLGYGSIYNHSNSNNAAYYYDEEKDVYCYYATQDIPQNSQIYISYGEVWWETRKQRGLVPR